MARPLRIEFPGAVYHVMARGNHRRAITADKKDNKDRQMWVATFWSDGTEILGQQFSYEFDHIGNRLSTGGRASAVSSYTANQLNQYVTRTVAPYWDVFGIANPTAAVTVNGTAASRQGEYFHHALPIPNSTAQYTEVNVTSQFGTTPYTQTNGQVFVPATPQGFWYDVDGNLTNDSRWIYSWDAENRLVKMVACNTNPAVGPQQWLQFAYDWQGRRISKKVGAIGSTTATNELRFVYDGWNLIGELNSSGSQVRSYVWGTDLSGSMQGAGGVGGLLWINDAATHFVSYDGNGNVTTLVNAADGAESARYEYGPFGEVIRATGPMAKANPIRFSTQYTDDETDLVCYLHRYYNASTGRWLSRDPLGELGFMLLKERRQPFIRTTVTFQEFKEQLNVLIAEPGGANRYAFVGNAPIGFYDYLGLKKVYQCFNGIHAYIKFDDGATFGFWPEKFTGRNMCCGKGVLKSPDPDDGPGSNCVEYTVKKEKQDAYYDCVRKTAEDDYKNQGMWYSVLGRNCQTWLISVFKKCNSQVLMTP